jgi:hypothetical protein
MIVRTLARETLGPKPDNYLLFMSSNLDVVAETPVVDASVHTCTILGVTGCKTGHVLESRCIIQDEVLRTELPTRTLLSWNSPRRLNKSTSATRVCLELPRSCVDLQSREWTWGIAQDSSNEPEKSSGSMTNTTIVNVGAWWPLRKICAEVYVLTARSRVYLYPPIKDGDTVARYSETWLIYWPLGL